MRSTLFALICVAIFLAPSVHAADERPDPCDAIEKRIEEIQRAIRSLLERIQNAWEKFWEEMRDVAAARGDLAALETEATRLHAEATREAFRAVLLDLIEGIAIDGVLAGIVAAIAAATGIGLAPLFIAASPIVAWQASQQVDEMLTLALQAVEMGQGSTDYAAARAWASDKGATSFLALLDILPRMEPAIDKIKKELDEAKPIAEEWKRLNDELSASNAKLLSAYDELHRCRQEEQDESVLVECNGTWYTRAEFERRQARDAFLCR